MISGILNRPRSDKVMFSELRTRVEMTFIHRMMITAGIMRTVIACIPVKTAAVCSMVSKVMYRTSEIEETSVRVFLIHPQITNIIHRINRTEKAFDSKKTSVCRTGKNLRAFGARFRNGQNGGAGREKETFRPEKVCPVSRCGGNFTKVQAKDNDTPKKITLGYWESPNGELLTKEKGSLEAAFPDTDVEWVEFQSGTDILTAMQSGSIDFATIGTPPAALGLAKGYPFKIFYCIGSWTSCGRKCSSDPG